MKRSNGLIAAGTVLSLVATLDMLLSPESVSLIDLVLRMSYVGTSFEFPSLFNMTFRLFPLFAFQAIMGILTTTTSARAVCIIFRVVS